MYINTISVYADCSVDIADTSGREDFATMSVSLCSIFYKQQYCNIKQIICNTNFNIVLIINSKYFRQLQFQWRFFNNK